MCLHNISKTRDYSEHINVNPVLVLKSKNNMFTELDSVIK